jgi:hypothetical protein
MLETVLNMLGLAISVGSVVAAGLTRQIILVIFACALVVTTGVAAWVAYEHDVELARVETELLNRLSHHRWTFERIRAETREADHRLLLAALSRAEDRNRVASRASECIHSDGLVLSTRLYFSTSAK